MSLVLARAQGPPPSAYDLFEAALLPDDNELRSLLQRVHADVNVSSPDVGYTALHISIVGHSHEAVEKLVNLGADIEAPTARGIRPLFLAVREGQTAIVKSLLAKFPSVDERHEGRTALHEAASMGNADIARLLVEHGASVHLSIANGMDPLFLAVQSKNVDIVKLMLEREANPNLYRSEDPPTPLHLAAKERDIEVMRTLLEAGTEVDVRDWDGNVPLFFVVEEGDLEAAKLLLLFGASIRIQRRDGDTAFDLAKGNREMIDLLRAERVLRGPRTGAGPTVGGKTRSRFTVLNPQQEPRNPDKLVACHGFEATITDFFTTGDDFEQFIPKTESVHDLLYGRGPRAIRSRLEGEAPSYTWYHLPSNNMDWVETLIQRLASEKGGISLERYDASREELELSTKSPRKSKKSKTIAKPTIRPQCHRTAARSLLSVEAEDSAHDTVAFVPFLHFETYNGYQQMVKALKYPSHILGRPPGMRPHGFYPGMHGVHHPSGAPPRRIFRTEYPPPPPPGFRARSRLRRTSNDDNQEWVHSTRNHEHDSDRSRSRSRSRIRFRRSTDLSSSRSSVPAPKPRWGFFTNLLSISRWRKKKQENASQTTASDVEQQPSRGRSSASRASRVSGTSEGTRPRQSEGTQRDDNNSFNAPTDNSRPAATAAAQAPTEPHNVPVEVERSSLPPAVSSDPRQGNEGPSHISERSQTENPSVQSGQPQNNTEPTSRARPGPMLSATGFGIPGVSELPLPQAAPFSRPQGPTSVPPPQAQPFGQYPAPFPGPPPPSAFFSAQPFPPQGPPPRPPYPSAAGPPWPGQSPHIPSPTHNLNEHLIRGYSKPGASSFHPRRTAEQHVYSDIETASERVEEQVVYRYTKDNLNTETKVFMVDQLWVWILGKDTIITCCPLRWDPWLHSGQMHTAWARSHEPRTQRADSWLPSRPTRVRTGDSRILARRSGPAMPPESNMTSEIDPEDPLNVLQTIQKQLLRPGRGTVESVHHLAAVITTCCVDVFDPQQVPEEFFFFHLFEQVIRRSAEKSALYLKNFRQALSEFKSGTIMTPEAVDITAETELMIEIDGLRQELQTIKSVLIDQRIVIQDMNAIMEQDAEYENVPPAVNTRTLENHLLRIDQMEQAAIKADQSLHRLVDLKQKQASLLEAWYAKESAQDTARQGKTVLVFTVVTILFLPVSFLAAVFAIDTEYPRTAADKIPFDYLMTYILSIGLGISLPLILIAFNVDRIVQWQAMARDVMKERWRWGLGGSGVAAVVAAVLAPLWTSALSNGIKTAVTLILLGFLAVLAISYGLRLIYYRERRKKSALSITSTVSSERMASMSVRR